VRCNVKCELECWILALERCLCAYVHVGSSASAATSICTYVVLEDELINYP
jgi:hypothetical protein